MKINNLLISASSLLGITAVGCANPTTNPNTKPPTDDSAKQPNIIVILVDDMGFSDLGCYGSEIETPNIDRLAANGIRYRTFYNCARSSPTRASLLTGLYPHQAGVGSLNKQPGYPDYQAYLNDRCITIPNAIEDAGYFSIMTGKWHLGIGNGVTPINRGFDRSLNGAAGGFYFYNDPDNKKLYLNDEVITPTDPRLPAEWYSTDLWVEYGLKFVDEALEEGKPFFWYLAHNAPHFPLQAPESTIAKYRGKYAEGYDVIRNRRFEKQKQLGLFDEDVRLTPRNPHPDNTPWDELTDELRDRQDHRMAIYAACIDEIDQATGKLIDYLEEKGILDNTVIFFLSDNGGNAESGFPGRWKGANPGGVNSEVWLGTPWADVANTPYFMYKHHGHQGGCATPLIIHYPDGITGKMRGSIDLENYGHLIDIMPTVIELAGGEYPSVYESRKITPMEGISLVPSFTGKKLDRRNPIIIEHEGNKALRDGDWKIVQEYEKNNKDRPWRLYNLRTDPTEMDDLSAQYPAIFNEMKAEYQQWADHIGVVPEIEFNTGPWYVPIEDYHK